MFVAGVFFLGGGCSCLAKLGRTGCPRGVILLTNLRIRGVFPRTPSAKHKVLVTVWLKNVEIHLEMFFVTFLCE